MKLTYNITGSKRKELAEAVAKVLKSTPNYLGAPSFAYEVGGYHIDKFGTVTGKDSERLEDELKKAGFDAEKSEYDINKLSVSIPLEGFTAEKLKNLEKLINAKSKLLKAALNADELSIKQTKDKLEFPWFEIDEKDKDCADKVNAYSALISKLCLAAKNKKRVMAKCRETKNSKYDMRCFLLSIGFIGEEYKTARKILLKNLKGSSAFKHTDKREAKDEFPE